MIWGLGKYWNAFHETKTWDVKKNIRISINGHINFFLIEPEYIYTSRPYKYCMINNYPETWEIIEGRGKIEYVKAMDD